MRFKVIMKTINNSSKMYGYCSLFIIYFVTFSLLIIENAMVAISRNKYSSHSSISMQFSTQSNLYSAQNLLLDEIINFDYVHAKRKRMKNKNNIFNLNKYSVKFSAASSAQFVYPTGSPTIKIPITSNPTDVPTDFPTIFVQINKPTISPSLTPSNQPTVSLNPTLFQTSEVFLDPSTIPTDIPTNVPSMTTSYPSTLNPVTTPSDEPSLNPSTIISITPTIDSSNIFPSTAPSDSPSIESTIFMPSIIASTAPSDEPSVIPSISVITIDPSEAPSIVPTDYPTINSTMIPSDEPTVLQTNVRPSEQPSTNIPSIIPSNSPLSSLPTFTPSTNLSISPNLTPTNYPNFDPSLSPSASQISLNNSTSGEPSDEPTISPSVSSISVSSLSPSTAWSSEQPLNIFPSDNPSSSPEYDIQSSIPTVTSTVNPTVAPTTSVPTDYPTDLTSEPTDTPTSVRSEDPSTYPIRPSTVPVNSPSTEPSEEPTISPTISSTNIQSGEPSDEPTIFPTASMTSIPSLSPSTTQPSEQPATRFPSENPSNEPSTTLPTITSSNLPSTGPSLLPSLLTSLPSFSSEPTTSPSFSSTISTVEPLDYPSLYPSLTPSSQSSTSPTSIIPSETPSTPMPTLFPTDIPSSVIPSLLPTTIPSSESTNFPSEIPSFSPINLPTISPSIFPIDEPSIHPTGPSFSPTVTPSLEPTDAPSLYPSLTPSILPSLNPSMAPSVRSTYSSSVTPTHKATTAPTTSSSPSISPFDPSIQPVSSTPSYPSTVQSSSKPIGIITRSSLPSSMPSLDLSLSKIESTPLYKNFTIAYSKLNSVPSSNSLYYSYFKYKGKIIGSSCEDWTNFALNSLKLPFVGVEFSNIQAIFGNDGSSSSNSNTINCPVKPLVQQIVQSLTTGVFSDTLCDGHHWRTYYCASSGFNFCVDCNIQCDSCLKNNSYYLNPCANSKCYEEVNNKVGSSFFGMIRFDAIIKPLYPAFQSLLYYESFKTSLIVTANISNPGIVYCAAMVGNISIMSSIPTQAYIQQQGFSVNTFSSGIVKVLIDKLQPETLYGIFCFTSDFKGHQMTAELYSKYSFSVVTQCCRSILFTTQNYSVFQSISQLNTLSAFSTPSLISFKIDTIPSRPVTIGLSISFYNGNSDCSNKNGNNTLLRPPKLMPTNFVFLPTSISLFNSFSIDGSPGCYRIVLSDISGDIMKFQSSILIISIQSSNSPIPLPKILSSSFSNDGLRIFCIFDSPTDRGSTQIKNFDSQFDCSILLDFPGIKYSSCQWSSSQQLTIVLGANIPISEVINVGDSLIFKTNIIKGTCSSCIYTTDTSNYQVVVTVPQSPIVPQPSLSAPAVVGLCDKITLDPTNSIGRGSRPWKILSWSIKSTSWSTSNIQNLQNYLNKVYPDTSQLVAIPSSYLSLGNIIISLILVNFFDKSSLREVTIDIVSSLNNPIVSILGPQTQYIYRWQALNLASSVLYSSCRSSNSSVSSFYNWKVYKGLNVLKSVTSKSLDVRSFKLDPFSLESATTYSIVLTVINKVSPQFSGSAISTVIVGQSGVVATIAGGSYQTVSLFSSLNLDASLSYDIDYPSSNNLTFQWNCIEISPVYGASCDIFGKNIISTSYQSVLNLASNITDSSKFEAKFMNFSVQVTNKNGNNGIAFVIVNIVNVIVPIIKMGSVSKKYDGGSKIIISGFLSNPSNTESMKAFWNINNNINISSIALTPTQLLILPNNSIVFQLAIKSFSFSNGMSYQLRLIAQISNNNQNSAYSEITISINSPPYGGVLKVLPTVGYELNTTFSFITSQWIADADNFPLQYLFTYYDSSATEQSSLKPSNEIQYVNSALSKGLMKNNFTIYCLVLTSDYYGSQSNATSSVQVLPIPNILKIVSLMDSLITEAFSNDDVSSVIQVLSAVSNSLSIANCSSAPDCNELNRNECKLVSNTCGDCKLGFIGFSGNSNFACSSSNNLLKIGESCKSDNDCVSGRCFDSVCKDQYKLCPNNCSNSGECISFSYLLQPSNIIPFCYSGDPTCSVKCYCNPGSFGYDCSYNNETFEARQLASQYLCDSLAQTIDKEDISNEVIISRSINVARLLSDLSLITDSILIQCANVLIKTVTKYPDISSSDNVITATITAFSNILNRGSNIPTYLLNNVTNSLNALIGGRQANSAVGESSTNEYSPSISFLTSVEALDSLSNKEYTSPQSNYDDFNNYPKSSVSINMNNNRRLISSSTPQRSAVGISMMQFLTNPTGIDTPYSKVTVQTTFYGPVKNIETQVSLISQVGIDYSFNANNETDVKTIICPVKSSSHNVTISCKSGSNYSVECPGNFKSGKIIFQCPIYRKVPICTSYNGSAFIRDNLCTPIVKSAFEISCQCKSDPKSISDSINSKQYSASYIITSTSYSESLTILEPINPILNVLLSNTVVITTAIIIAALIVFIAIRFNQKKSITKYLSNNSKKLDDLSIYSFFKYLLPEEFDVSKSFNQFLYSEHDFSFSRIEKDISIQNGLSGAAKIITYALIDTIIIVNWFNDTTTCQSKSNEQSCISSSWIDLHYNMCNWDVSSTTCSFSSSNISFISIIFLVLLVSIVVLPIDTIFRMLVSQAFAINKSNIKSNKILAVYSDSDEITQTELASAQTRRGSLLRAAAYKRMKDRMDYFFPSTERDVLMRTCEPLLGTEPYSRKSFMYNMLMRIIFMSYGIGDPYNASALLQHPRGKDLILYQLKLSRKRASQLIHTLDSILDRNGKDRYLVQQFIIDYMTGYRKQIAINIVNSKYNKGRNQRGNIYLGYLSVFIVFVYIILSLVYVFYSGSKLGSTSSNLWLAVLLIAIGEDIIWVQSFRIFTKFLFIPSIAKREYLAIYHVLSARTRSILRNKGAEMMKNSKSLLQHFNSACRAARIYPELTSSRLLMSLSDYDIPIQHLVKDDILYKEDINNYNNNNYYYYLYKLVKYIQSFIVILYNIFEILFISILQLFPDRIQTLILEEISVILLNGLLVGLYFSGQYSVLLMGVLIGTVILIILLFFVQIYTKDNSIYYKLNNAAQVVEYDNNNNNNNNNNKGSKKGIYESVNIDLLNEDSVLKLKDKPELNVNKNTSFYNRQTSNQVIIISDNTDEKNIDLFDEKPSAAEFSRVKKSQQLQQLQQNLVIESEDKLGLSYEKLLNDVNAKQKRKLARKKIKSKAIKYLTNHNINIENFSSIAAAPLDAEVIEVTNNNEISDIHNKLESSSIFNKMRNESPLINFSINDDVQTPLISTNLDELMIANSYSHNSNEIKAPPRKIVLPPIDLEGPKIANIKSPERRKKRQKRKEKIEKEVNDHIGIDIKDVSP